MLPAVLPSRQGHLDHRAWPKVTAAVRVFGQSEATITRWRDRAARQAQRLHRHFLHDMCLPHVQLDEIRTRLRPRERMNWLPLPNSPATAPA
jgi:hypothetical protein